MTRFKQLKTLATAPYEKPPVPGVLKTAEDAAANTHPYPIFFHPLYFVCVCVECGCKEVGPRRSDLLGALYDRAKHAETHS
jgi:hypothetical protein